MAKVLARRLPAWIKLLETIVDYATRYHHEFDVTISTTIIGRKLSLNLKGRMVRKPLE